MIRNWEHNKSSSNPYIYEEKGIFFLRYNLLHTHIHLASNLAEVRRQLAKADETAIRQGTASQHVPGSVFIRNGLEIEEQQLVSPYPSCIGNVLIHFVSDDNLPPPLRRIHKNLTHKLHQFKKSAIPSRDGSKNGSNSTSFICPGLLYPHSTHLRTTLKATTRKWLRIYLSSSLQA